MQTALYRKALSHSWRLAWKHVWLWPLGLFASMLGQMGIFDLLAKAGAGVSNFVVIPSWLSAPKLTVLLFVQLGLPLEGWIWLILLFVILFGLFIGFVFVAVVSQGALVDMTARSKISRKKTFPAVEKSWHTGVYHFWTLLGINILRKVVLIIVFLSVALTATSVASATSSLNIVLFFISFFLAIFIGMIISLMLVYAVGYVVVEKYTFSQSISGAWRLFHDHPLVSIEVGLVLLFANVVVAVITIFGIFLLFLPAIILWFVGVLAGSYLAFSIAFFIGVMASILYVMLVGSVFTVFTTSTWTYLFMHMHKNGVKSRIMHWLR
ncbi:MAG: hypothetical protein ABII02_03115 [Candidatus Magasanikbacteria bacterium]